MSEPLSLIEFIRELLENSSLQEQFKQEPAVALHAVGLGHIDAHDVHDALTLVNDDSQHADFTHAYLGGAGSGAHSSVVAPAVHGHESAAAYVHRYVTNTFVDDRRTTVAHPVGQHVDTRGADFDQDIDVHSTTASGDGTVATGHDLDDSTITTGAGDQIGSGDVSGDGNVVGDGDGNSVATGSHDTTAFGEGNATGTDVSGDARIGDGAAFASGGDAAVTSTDDSVHDSGNSSTDDSTHGSSNDYSNNAVTHSDNDTTDSGVHHTSIIETETDMDDVDNDRSDSSLHLHTH